MCLILFAYKTHPAYKLIVAANRDEFYHRPTSQAAFWEDDKRVLAGRDLEAGGTWMGVNTAGQLAMLTNYRDLKNIKPEAPSRGFLVSDFLQNEQEASEYLHHISMKGDQYNGFNLVTGNAEELYYYGNYQEGVQQIKPGVHGLSNALLNTEWPKVNKGRERLQSVIGDDFDVEDLFSVLKDDVKAPDVELPDTGVGLEMERMLSPMFIQSANYGSRCSTVLTVTHSGHFTFIERTYDPAGLTFADVTYEFKL